MNYQRHRKYNEELKKLIEKNQKELSKLTGEKRMKLENLLKKQAKDISVGKVEKKETKKEVKKKVK